LWVEDTDSLELGGNLDDANKTLGLELSWKFRSTRSLFASLTEELSRRPAVAPPAFERLPFDATGAGYAVDARSEKTAALRNALVDLTDAYLEVEHAGKGTRARARRFLTGFLKQVGAPYVQAKGSLGGAAASDAGAMLGWRLSRAELRAAELEPLLVDFDGLLRDREVWKILAKHFDLDPKVLPKSRLVPLKGKGVPAGARALVVTIPPGVTEKIRKTAGSRMKGDTKKPTQFVLALCSDGADASVILATTDQKDAAERLRAFFAEGGKRLSDRTELATMKSQRALYAEFFTLLGLFDSLSASNANPALLPSHGETPILWNYTATPGPPLVLSAAISIPSAAFADLPGAVTNLGGSF